jgi:hypothetical protein
MASTAKTAFGLLCGLVYSASFPGGAHAAPQRNVGVHLAPEALGPLTQAVTAELPRDLPIDDLHTSLLPCPVGAGISLDMSQAKAQIDLHELTVMPQNGAVNVHAMFDLAGAAHVQLTNAVACLSDLSCDLAFDTRGANVSSALALAISSGTVSAGVNDLQIALQPNDLHVHISNCALQYLNGQLLDLITQQVAQLSQSMVARLLKSVLPPLIEDKLQQQLGRSGMLMGFGYDVAATDLSVSQGGIDAYLQLGVRYTGPAAACISDEASAAARDAPASDRGGQAFTMSSAPGGPLAIGVTYGLLDQVSSAAWQSGLLCIDDSKAKSLGLDLGDAASLVPGLPSGTAIHFSVRTDQPPAIAAGPDGSLSLDLEGVELHVTLAAPGVAPADIVVGTDATIAAKAAVDPMSGMLTLALVDLDVRRLTVTSGQDTATSFSLDPARLEVLMKDVVLPLAAEHLSNAPVAPAEFGFDKFFIGLDTLVNRDEGLYVGMRPFVRPASDTVAPTARFHGNVAALQRPGMARFMMDGTDDATPPSLMRYAYRLDGGALSAPKFGSEVMIPVVAPGPHRVDIQALDVNDNASMAVSTNFEIDAVPPVLTVTAQPEAVVRAASVAVDFSGSDDRSPAGALTYAWRLEQALPGQTAKRVGGGDRAPLTGAGHIDVDHLESHGVYNLTVLLYDEAGNVTSQTIGFGVADTGGCSILGLGTGVAGGSPALATLLFLCLVGLALRRGSAATRPVRRR